MHSFKPKLKYSFTSLAGASDAAKALKFIEYTITKENYCRNTNALLSNSLK